MTESNSSEDRLRQHPKERFAPPQIPIDLAAVTAKLRAEPKAIEQGRHQQTLYHHGGCTIALFIFEPGTQMSEHKAKGTVSIHVLHGHLKITAEGKVHDLRTGQLLVLASGVPHSVAAEEKTEMLLNVSLAQDSTAPGK